MANIYSSLASYVTKVSFQNSMTFSTRHSFSRGSVQSYCKVCTNPSSCKMLPDCGVLLSHRTFLGSFLFHSFLPSISRLTSRPFQYFGSYNQNSLACFLRGVQLIYLPSLSIQNHLVLLQCTTNSFFCYGSR